jgi:hypothetical protein
VHDVTSGTLRELSGHNAIDIVLDSGTPLYAVTSGTAYRLTNWTIPGGPQGYAVVVVSDVLRDDTGHAIAFLYGHVRVDRSRVREQRLRRLDHFEMHVGRSDQSSPAAR